MLRKRDPRLLGTILLCAGTMICALAVLLVKSEVLRVALIGAGALMIGAGLVSSRRTG